MDDQAAEATNVPVTGSERAEPVRSRWSPKPEQILILESIFNSGMVNPPKEETVRIRKLLERFGSVGDANVFYWFQNRRSRSRRRQRQLQAGMVGESARLPIMGLTIQYDPATTSSSAACVASTSSSVPSPPSSSCFFPSPSYSCGGFAENSSDELFSMSQEMGMGELEQTPSVSSTFWPSNNANFHYQSG
ncbi:wuschel-related homeobox [Asimina triloba]